MEDSTQIHELLVTILTYGGETLGRLPDGKAVFVPFSIPGEKVRVRLVEEKRRYARAELLKVLEPSEERIASRCNHFTKCGGCHYQHMSYENQLRTKSDILRDQLKRIGKIANPPVEQTIPSPHKFKYRNHIQFHLSPKGDLGFYEARSQKVFAVQECHLPEEAIIDLWPLLDTEFIPGLDRIGIRLGVEDEILVNLIGDDQSIPDFSVEDLPISAVFLGPSGIQVLAGSDHLIMEVRGRSFRVTAGSFFQVNTRMAEQLVEFLLLSLPDDRRISVVDAYAGVGLFSAFLAERVERVIGIESSEFACEDYVVNLDEFDNVELYQAPVEKLLPFLDEQIDIIVADPPREGLDVRAIDGILRLNPELLVYVSCDPATLARDGRRLVKGGYNLVKATPFDLFPQTYHIESISIWGR